VFSCSESEQKQLNTWVSFQPAEQPLLGQFSVSGNISERHWDDSSGSQPVGSGASVTGLAGSDAIEVTTAREIA
jgi:hypothetical protein